MKKSYIILLIVLTLLMSTINITLAEEQSNLIINPGFENDIIGWSVRNKAQLEWTAGGAEGSNGCVKVKRGGSNFYSATQNIKLIKGETYAISFYVKLEKGKDIFSLIFFHSSGRRTLIQNVPVNNKWKKIQTTFKFDGKNENGEDVKAYTQLDFRINDGYQDITYFLDEVNFIPMGNVKEKDISVSSDTYVDTMPAKRDVKNVPFTDIQGSWAKSSVQVLYANSILNGVSENKFQPERTVTRAEFITVIINSLKLQVDKYNGIYKDVKSDDWFSANIQAAYDFGLINPSMTLGGDFKPNAPLTREDMCMLLAGFIRLKNVAKKDAIIEFKDIDSLSEVAFDSVRTAVAYGIITGYPDGTFSPKALVTRAQMAEVIKRLFELDTRIAIYVDAESGSDVNEGTETNPLKTLQKAADMVAQYNKNMMCNLFVFVKGKNVITDTLILGTQHSGTNGYNVVFTSWGSDKAVISGEQQVTGFKPYKDGIYRAKVDKRIRSRQFFVNGLRATRARSEGGLSNPTSDTIGHTTTDTFLANFKRISELELVYKTNWTNGRCSVDKIIPDEKEGTIRLVMKQPMWTYLQTRGAPYITVLRRPGPDWYENALELLDKPGEWYLDSREGYLYYMPRGFEDLSTANCIMPVTERLVDLSGTPDDLIHNIVFDNLEFKYTTWMRPTTNGGHSDSQNNEITEVGKEDVPNGSPKVMTEAAVMGKNVRYIDFNNCVFDKLGIIGLGIMEVCKDFNVTGCEFYDISGNGINISEGYSPKNVGKSAFYDLMLEGVQDIPLIPMQYRNKNINISNNYIWDIGTDYFSSSCIGLMYGEDTILSHNEMFNYPYCGMHIGHGNVIETYTTSGLRAEDNYSHRGMTEICDGGAFYTFGPTGGIRNINIFKGNYVTGEIRKGGCFYTDNRTTDYVATQNVFSNLDTDFKKNEWHFFNDPVRVKIFDNYMTHDPKILRWGEASERKRNIDPRNSFEVPKYFPDGNWPLEARDIIDKSGLEPKYLANIKNTLQWLELPELDTHLDFSIKETTMDTYVNTVYPPIEKDLGIGETYTIKHVLKTREDNKYMKSGSETLPNVKLYYASSDENIASVDSKGNVTGKSQGIATIRLYAVDGEMCREKSVKFYVGDAVNEILIAPDKINLYEQIGYQTVSIDTKSAFGREDKVTDVKYTTEDASIATCDAQGKVIGIKPGKTALVATMNIQGKEIIKKIDIQVDKVNPLDENASSQNGRLLCNPKGWLPGKGEVVPLSDGIQISTKDFLAFDKIFVNDMFEFNVKVNASGGWPSIGLRQRDADKSYAYTDLYMITFNKDGAIELQRFNADKEHIVIYGKINGFTPVGGLAQPGGFKYNEQFKVKTAAVNVDNGVRILVYINDKKVVDYVDTSEDAIKAPGYFTSYVQSGSMNISSVK